MKKWLEGIDALKPPSACSIDRSTVASIYLFDLNTIRRYNDNYRYILTCIDVYLNMVERYHLKQKGIDTFV